MEEEVSNHQQLPCRQLKRVLQGKRGFTWRAKVHQAATRTHIGDVAVEHLVARERRGARTEDQLEAWDTRRRVTAEPYFDAESKRV